MLAWHTASSGTCPEGAAWAPTAPWCPRGSILVVQRPGGPDFFFWPPSRADFSIKWAIKWRLRGISARDSAFLGLLRPSIPGAGYPTPGPCWLVAGQSRGRPWSELIFFPCAEGANYTHATGNPSHPRSYWGALKPPRGSVVSPHMPRLVGLPPGF